MAHMKREITCTVLHRSTSCSCSSERMSSHRPT
uniref:Uncharacterized protein n=1 Tax=Anguilla anguilla TaxID=7936 RepID=A0A0E9VDV6_ANGAN